MTPPPTSKRVRLTISVPENVHEAYTHISDITGRSMGWEMGQWLDATLLAAVQMAEHMEVARNSPRRAMAQLVDLTAALESVERVRRSTSEESTGPARRAAELHGRPGTAIPPSSNTGGKPPKQHSRAGGSK